MDGIITGLSSTFGLVPGPYHKESMVCQYFNAINSQGSIWFGSDPFAYSTPVLMAQFILIFFITRAVHFFLKPFQQNIMTAQIIAGILMGPSFLARERMYTDRFLPPGGRLNLNTIADVGLMLHLFLLGVQIDVTMLRKAGKEAALIGTTGFVLAYVLGGLAMVTLPYMVMLDEKFIKSLPLITTVTSLTSFPVITSLLADLNILNSEMGRLATFSSMVADIWSYFIHIAMVEVGLAVRTSQWGLLWSIFWYTIYMISIVFVLRPLILRIAKQVFEGKPMKESHFIHILVMVFVCGLCSEVLGQHSCLGSFILGLVIPDGPPLGESLVYKLEAMSTVVLLPAKLVIAGLNVDLFSFGRKSGMVVELIIIFGYIGKFLGTLVTALYCSVPFGDAISLALVMCCKGIVDIALYSTLKDEGSVDNQEYALLIITMLIVTGVARTLVGHLYDPSRRYMVHRRSTILESSCDNSELRMLVCVHNENNVPAFITLLEASNPAKQSPISVVVLNLIELKGRTASILVPTFLQGKLTSTFRHSEQIANAFSYYAQENQGRVSLQNFTAVAPYSSMHDDVCMLALDKRITIVIVPFHKQWTIGETVGGVFRSIRTVNQNIINKAPCSVAVLVDRSQISNVRPALTSQSSFRIALLFLGGADDREALAYVSRMADHPYVSLTVAWIRPWVDSKVRKKMEDDLDIEMMNEFKDKAMDKKRIVFKEEMVEDAVGTTQLIHSMKESFDLLVVGRHHEPDSPVILGLTEWGSECPELGAIGDVLASSDFRFSVLVLRQQPIGAGFLHTNFSSRFL